MERKPKVSVVMTVYNEEDWIRRSVISVLNQTYEDFEFVIVNDGSTDRTREILDSEFSDRRIKIFNRENRGRVKALNQAVKLTAGEYIAILDADDYCLPERLKKQVEFLDRNPSVGIVGTAYYRYDEIRKEKCIRRYPTEDEQIRKEMAKYIPMAHSSVMMRKSCLEKTGHYNEQFDTLQDMELFIRIAKKYKLSNLREPLMVRDIRSDSFFHRSFEQSERNRLLIRLNLRAIRELSLPIKYYIFPLGRIIYFWLPNNLKRIVRKLFSDIIEEDLK